MKKNLNKDLTMNKIKIIENRSNEMLKIILKKDNIEKIWYKLFKKFFMKKIIIFLIILFFYSCDGEIISTTEFLSVKYTITEINKGCCRKRDRMYLVESGVQTPKLNQYKTVYFRDVFSNYQPTDYINIKVGQTIQLKYITYTYKSGRKFTYIRGIQ